MKRKLVPAGHRVLVKLKQIEKEKEVVNDWGFVTEIKDERALEREQYATQEAYVMDLGITAFRGFDSGEPWCKKGDLVLICKYSGEDRKDLEEGEIYRIINDEDVIGVFREGQP